ncbi:MAG TPA: ornithine carbamoyltransferase [bacterium]
MARHFLTLGDVSPAELAGLVSRAAELKRRPSAARRTLAGRVVALMFQKPSMRTRVSFEVGVARLGGSTIYLGDETVKLGEREPVKDVARGLSRYVDAVVLRTFSHRIVEEFAACAGVPVVNGLSDAAHPCQALGDLLTMREHCGRLEGLRIAYVGDGNNVLHSLIEGCAMLGVHATVSTPEAYRPDAAVWTRVQALAARRGAELRWVPDPREAVRGARIIYTDVWVSMGQEEERQSRVKVFRPFQVDSALVKRAAPECRVMHCLPAHRGEEITEEVIESASSVVFDQAENRLHAQNALMLLLLGRGGRPRARSVQR